jgi:hypothetical protein
MGADSRYWAREAQRDDQQCVLVEACDGAEDGLFLPRSVCRASVGLGLCGAVSEWQSRREPSQNLMADVAHAVGKSAAAIRPTGR